MQSNNHVSDTDINKIVSLSDEAVEKMNEIIWALNQGSQQLEELIYYTRSQCSEITNNAGIAFTFELPENIPAKIVDWKDCRNIYLLVKEGVNNAVKHAEATSVIVECNISDKVQFSIIDNGKGFDPEMARKNGNGLNNYQKRIAVLKGSYQIKTGNGHGTCLMLNFPLMNL
ncbi:MAG: ATP-binding protein [Segetibacter sp.]